MTFPYLTTDSDIFFFPAILFADVTSLSAQSFVAPYKFIGEQALSVDSAITFFTPVVIAHSTKFCVPITFVLINSIGLYSAAGTCFKAAA